MTRKVERLYPLILGLPVGAISGIAYFLFLAPTVAELRDLFSAILGTALSVLFSIETRPVIEDLKDARAYKPLMGYLLSAMKSSFLIAFLSAVGMVGYGRLPWLWQGLFVVAWCSTLMIAVLSCTRIIRLFGEIITSDD
jgi:hypothetical protein